jgi:hypothetical protein
LLLLPVEEMEKKSIQVLALPVITLVLQELQNLPMLPLGVQDQIKELKLLQLP